jgi:hypothetical protein
MENVDATVIATSLPAISRDLKVDPIALKLALTSYLLSLAVFIPVSGWMADKFGARTVFRLAIVVFTLGSLACGFAVSLPDLVLYRILQGIGGAMMVPVGRLVILRLVPKHELVSALAWLVVPALIGPMIGPPLGGFITTYFHWRWIFWINSDRHHRLPARDKYIETSVKRKCRRSTSVHPLWRRVFGLAGFTTSGGFTGVARLHDRRRRGRDVSLRPSRARASGAAVDLKLPPVPTFRASVVGGSLFGSSAPLPPVSGYRRCTGLLLSRCGRRDADATSAAPVLRLRHQARANVMWLLRFVAVCGCFSRVRPISSSLAHCSPAASSARCNSPASTRSPLLISAQAP